MKLYNYWRSSSSHRVRIALHLKGIPFEYVVVNLLADDQWKPEHQARSPRNTVPVLELDDGRTLVESLAIIQYLDELKPDPPLLPADLYLRAQARSLAEMVNSGMQPFQNTSVGKYVKTELKSDPKTWSRHWLTVGLTALEHAAQATAGRFLVGDQPTVADVYLVPQILAARRFDVNLEPFATLRRVEEACLALPGFQLAQPEAQPDAPRAA